MEEEDFQQKNVYNEALNQLRQKFPYLLQTPLSNSLLAPDIELNVGVSPSISLASSREELLRLQQIIILTLRAGNLVQFQPPVVQCQFGCLPNNTNIVRIRWRVDLAASPQQPVLFDGESVVQLNGSSIDTLRLESVNFNGQPQDAVTIGRFLSSSRRAVQQVQSSPLLQPFLTSLSPLLDTLLLSSSSNTSLEDSLSEESSSIFLIRPINSTNTANATKSSNGEAQWVPLEEYPSNSSDFPLPGSGSWSKYALFHKRAEQFYKEVLPALQDGTIDESCFAREARLITQDVGVKNPQRFYQTLAIGRQQSGAQFQCTGIKAVWNDNAVEVSYTTTIPSLPSALRFRGADVFAFNDADPVQIANIRQVQFQNEEPSSAWDGTLVMKSLAKAVETGRPDTWADLILLPKSGQSRSFPRKSRSDTAATTIYRIMERLHIDLRQLAGQNETAVVPASNYLDEAVQLTGYLNETLVKGSALYSRSILLAVQSFKAALNSNQIKSKQAPAVRIELTENGNVRCALTLFLQVVGVPASVNVPVKLQIDFEYVADPDSGRIIQHRLLESRINGQLTPGDVVSRWIRRFTDPSSKRSEEEDWLGSALDTIKWMRSLRPE
ncbi:hypothetical protein FisN_18Hh040 [Fistulifera solaris]|uniref:Uncharacterized protein n=1 Tax=Fistulifera solaris TaxID=1519565 RepID=A0A1Z5JV93_FISSO|nr:hypothetical protein FisN_18Hh040 [Fistulifera solaris]|eukprot:GAX17839.1 hypothetical protein FisN_18Hh040 [Fistulifera solaris]